MDRKAWIVIVLCIASLGLWQWAYVKYYSPTPEQAAEAARIVEQARAVETSATPAPTPAPPDRPSEPAEAPPVAAPRVPREQIKVATGLAEFYFESDSGGLARVVLLGHMGEQGANVTLNIPEAMPIGALGDEAGSVSGGFERVQTGRPNEVAFVRESAEGLNVRKSFVVDEADGGQGNYVVNLEVTFTNPADAARERGGFFISTGGVARSITGHADVYG